MYTPTVLLAGLVLATACSRPATGSDPQRVASSDTATMVLIDTRRSDVLPYIHHLSAYSPQGSLRWQRSDLGNTNTQRYVYRNGTVFLATGFYDQATGSSYRGFHAMRAKDGTDLWSISNVQTQFYSYTASDTALYMSVMEGNQSFLRAYNAQTGALRWQLPQTRSLAQLRYADGTLYYVSFQPLTSGAEVVAFDPATRQQKWAAPLGSAVTNFVSGIRLSDNTLYITNSSGAIRAYDRATGGLRWTGVSAYTNPNPAGGTVLAQGSQGAVAGLDGATGAVLWSWQLGGGTPSSAFALDDNTVSFSELASQSQHFLTRLNAATGSLIWRYAVPARYSEFVVNEDRGFALRPFETGTAAPPFGKILFYNLNNGAATDSILINDNEIAQLSVITSSGRVRGSGN